MRIAMPLAEGKLAMHFGHCEEFALIDIDSDSKQIISKTTISSPTHQPGLFPGWLAGQGAGVIIAGGMGSRAQTLFAEHGIKVVVGATSETPELLAEQYIAGTLESGDNVCDH
jgi:ATP-binding protein involved in chromosome partitioning